MQADLGVKGDGLKDVPGEGTREVPADQVVFLACRLTGVNQVRTARNVDDGVRQSLIKRHCRFTEPADTRLVADGLPQHLTKGDCDIFHGVVDIDVGVSGGPDREVDQLVLGQRRQHVVIEGYGRADLGAPGAVEVEFDEN